MTGHNGRACAQAAHEMAEFAAYLDALSRREAAIAYRGWARELAEGPSDDRVRFICREVLRSLRPGPGTLSDLYVMGADGAPDDAESRAYMDLVRGLRRFAAGQLPLTAKARRLLDP